MGDLLDDLEKFEREFRSGRINQEPRPRFEYVRLPSDEPGRFEWSEAALKKNPGLRKYHTNISQRGPRKP